MILMANFDGTFARAVVSCRGDSKEDCTLTPFTPAVSVREIIFISPSTLRIATAERLLAERF